MSKPQSLEGKINQAGNVVHMLRNGKPGVERHAQVEMRAIVGPVPYSRAAREEYAAGWRTARS